MKHPIRNTIISRILFPLIPLKSSFRSCYWRQFQFYLLYGIRKIPERSIFKWLDHNRVSKSEIGIIIRLYSINDKRNCSIRIFCIINHLSKGRIWAGINHFIFITVAALIISTMLSQLIHRYRKIGGHNLFKFLCRNFSNLPFLNFRLYKSDKYLHTYKASVCPPHYYCPQFVTSTL